MGCERPGYLNDLEGRPSEMPGDVLVFDPFGLQKGTPPGFSDERHRIEAGELALSMSATVVEPGDLDFRMCATA